MRFLAIAVVLIAVLIASNVSCVQYTYSVEVISFDDAPVVSFVDGNSEFQQTFNPSYVLPSTGTAGKQGLLIRTQNCSAAVGGTCVFCSGSSSNASVITFAELQSGGDSKTAPVFAPLTASSIVYDNAISGLGDMTVFGTEDPRLAYDESTGIYYLFFTCYGKSTVLLCQAYSKNPTDPSSWTTVGPVFPQTQGSKSGALLIRDQPPHYLLWGDEQIRIAQSSNLTHWPDEGQVIIAPRADHFDNGLVESGPPPLKLSTGDYLFLHNSANSGFPQSGEYHASWAILSGADPSQVLARAEDPLLSPDALWERGVSPWTCNVPRVVFLEAAAPTELPDVFRIYFGGADAVVGSAVVKVTAAIVVE
eukprot:TRINITY_DN14077_c0_g1_i1.p1 TRINITY_DN14077_c0_g1~~TRINITY_DN14077_c0_g1_i1.p1  ORF type:complete len:363 (-),score=69.96 TRINITY_DN14077_c0_g1_i1:261-1349(-)